MPIKKFPCPECAKAGEKTVYATARHLGIHRRTAHKIVGTSVSATANRERRAKAARDAKRAAKQIQVAPTEFVREIQAIEVEPRPLAVRANGHYHGTVGFVAGKTQSALEAEAERYHLPKEKFKKDVVEYLAFLLAQ
jgi:ribosomal protein L21E